jgi:FixJ family two-component response regulator
LPAAHEPFLKVLIVEDDADVAMACEQTMRLEGLDCICVSSAEQAQKHLSPDFAGIVVSDIRLPQMSGLGLLAAVRVLDAELPVILITGHGDISMAVQAMKDGAADFLEKPFAPERLVEAVRRALERRRLVLEVRSLRQQLQSRDVLQHQLLGRSLPMQQLRSTLQSLAASEADVLIWGKRAPARKESRAACMNPAGARAAILSPSTAAACRRRCLTAKCSAARPGPLPARAKSASARSNMPAAAPCFSTRSKACPWPCRPSCCACCRKECWSAWARTRSLPSTAV